MVISGGTVASTATVENENTLLVTGGTVSGTLINDNGDGTTITQSGGTVSGFVSNNGSYIVSGGTFSAAGANGGPQNTVTGSFTLETGGTINAATNTFVNQGSFGYVGGTFTGKLPKPGSRQLLRNRPVAQQRRGE